MKPERDDDPDCSNPLRQRREGQRREPGQATDLHHVPQPQQERVCHRAVGIYVTVHPVFNEMEVEGTSPACDQHAQGQACIGLLLEIHHPAVQDDPLLVHTALRTCGQGNAAGRAGLPKVLYVTPRPPHVEADEHMREHGPHPQRGHHKVHRDKLAHDREHAYEEHHSTPGRGQLEQPEVDVGDDIDDLGNTKRVAGRLRPPRLDGLQAGVLLGRVVEERQEDGPAPHAPARFQVALGEHVPVLRDVVGVPASHGGSKDQAQGVAGERHVAIDGVCEARKLVDRSEERGCPHERWL
mmetsp:Transcript_57833/g.134706  ORF Transcript_57833/g.134706 Transcript_57833/m.134706 type:complete len:296 (-) Transcript_57833:1103-1990(-)